MIRFIITLFGLTLFLAAPVAAQDRDETLADIRQQLSVLYVEVQRLKRELSTTGSPSVSLSGTTALERIDSMEAELRRLTSSTEALQNRVDRIVVDGTNRIGDLEFRLVELEGGDLGALADATTLGGDDGSGLPLVAAPQTSEATGSTGVELAVGEQRDFDQAKALYDGGSYADAAASFAAYTEAYYGGPLTGEAHFWRGESLSAMGDASAAARAYLESFSGDPEGHIAPDALLRLGVSLDKLGQFDEGCTMLSEVSSRFPSSAASIEAQTARVSMGCS
jgi:tol-pal system protein YbgF